MKGDCCLFPGYSQYNCFMHIFCDVLKEHKDEFVALSVDVSDLGSHSSHIGAATLCASSCTVAPSISSISLCAGWLVENVKSLYL